MKEDGAVSDDAKSLPYFEKPLNSRVKYRGQKLFNKTSNLTREKKIPRIDNGVKFGLQVLANLKRQFEISDLVPY